MWGLCTYTVPVSSTFVILWYVFQFFPNEPTYTIWPKSFVERVLSLLLGAALALFDPSLRFRRSLFRRCIMYVKTYTASDSRMLHRK